MCENTEHPLTEAQMHAIHDAPGTFYSRLRAAFDAGREHERTHADDGWEPLGRDDELRVGDEARWMQDGLTCSGVVASIDADGYPLTAEGSIIGNPRSRTWSVRRAPVTWHRLPIRHPAHLTDVRVKTASGENETFAYMALDGELDWCGVSDDGKFRYWKSPHIHACTLDGTRLKRDGEFEDGEPRFREEVGE